MKQYFDVGVVIPLEEELIEFQQEFDLVKNYSTDTLFVHSFNTASKGISGIVIQQDQMGKMAAFRAAEHLLNEYNIGVMVCLGIAGGLSTDLHIGDVCYSERIIDVYDNAKVWPAAGSVDTELRCLMELEVSNAETNVQPRVQA